MNYVIKRGKIGDAVNFNDGEMLIIDGIIDTDDESVYLFNSNSKTPLRVPTNSKEICSITHTVSNLDMFDSYYLEAVEALATARRFIHDNAIDGAFDNLLALKVLAQLMRDTVSLIDDEQ